MFRIVKKKKLAPNIFEMQIEASLIAKKSQPGQFIMLKIDELGERIPLTIAGVDGSSILIVFQVAGVTTSRLSEKNKDDFLMDIAGPLGKATEVENFGKVICIGGGVGIAELYPVASSYKQAKNYVVSIIGSKSKEFIIYENYLNPVSDELFITTDDGSYGRKGFVTDVLKELLERGRSFDLAYAVGPVKMMEKVCSLTVPKKIKSVVSLNSILVDGTGMCGSCRVEVGGETKFVCVDGPEFDGSLVNFKQLEARQLLFKEQEDCALSVKGIKI